MVFFFFFLCQSLLSRTLYWSDIVLWLNGQINKNEQNGRTAWNDDKISTTLFPSSFFFFTLCSFPLFFAWYLYAVFFQHLFISRSFRFFFSFFFFIILFLFKYRCYFYPRLYISFLWSKNFFFFFFNDRSIELYSTTNR